MKLSGYTTTRNCYKLQYPFEKSILSMLDFCDEVVVGDSSDVGEGTMERLLELEKENPKLKVHHWDLDYKSPNYGIFDGVMKANARSKCSGDWLIQKDMDEFFHEDDSNKIRKLCEELEKQQNVNAVAMPVVEYWGSIAKVRCDINPWKERISKNNPDITHGIPVQLRVYKDGLLYSKHGSDGCNLINKQTGEMYPVAGFMTQQAASLRSLAVSDERYLPHYEKWYNEIVDQLPTIYHFSWYDIKRKIEIYRDYWGNHWSSLYGETKDTSNMFFNLPWEKVSEEMIVAKAKELSENTGGHVFHTPYTGQKTNHVQINKSPPKAAIDWMKLK